MEPADKYTRFEDLAENERLGTDYWIQLRDRGSPVSIIAPHGGRIEPNSCDIARKIAGRAFNYYCFEGLKNKNNIDLHITSHKFDEPRALKLIKATQIVVTIHAMKSVDTDVCVGGRNSPLGQKILTALNAAGISCRMAKKRFAGVHPGNICNRGKTKKGVQLEISRGLRDCPPAISHLSDVVSTVLKDEAKCLL